tara:strand:+ start:766 stop:1272 length:507 start_codon:yes stop_codon:yes gene_type:complete
MKTTKTKLRQIIREILEKDVQSGKIRKITEARNVSFPFSEIADYFQDKGYKVTKAISGDARGSAQFQLPLSVPGGTRDLGYYVDVKYEYGTFYFFWFLRTKRPNGKIHVMKPGDGKSRWEVEYIQKDLKTVMDEIDYEISVYDAEGINPFDKKLGSSSRAPSRFSAKG